MSYYTPKEYLTMRNRSKGTLPPLCSRCSGSGTVLRDKKYKDKEGRTQTMITKEKCSSCGGTGRR